MNKWSCVWRTLPYCDSSSSVRSVLYWEVVVSSALVQQVTVFTGDDFRLVHKTGCVGLLCSWIQMAAFIQRPWFWLKIYNSITSEIIRWQKGKGVWEETGIRFPWDVVVLFSPFTNDDTYGGWDPLSMRCCGFIQSHHQRRYLWRLGSAFHEVLWFCSVFPPTTILMETGIRFLWGFVVLFSPSTNDDTYGKKTLFGLFQGMTPAYRSFKCLSAWL
jgi:hypothetical protein